MKKILILVLALFLINFVSATDIAYVVKNPDIIDANFIQIIQNEGYTYDLIDDSDISKTNFESYSMILVGNERIRNLPINSYPTLIVNPDYYQEWSKSIGSSSGNYPLSSYNANNEHFITLGLNKEFDVYTSCCSNSGNSLKLHYLKSTKYDSGRVITTGDSSGDSGNYVIATKKNPERVFFGITESDYWTQESKLLFKNSINWIIKGDDADDDGYSTNNDCNDENPSIHPDAEEILDSVNQNCVNDAPTRLDGQLESLSWIQNNNYNLNLDNYFKDTDGDELIFDVYSRSGDNIVVTINNNLVTLKPQTGWTGENWLIFRAKDTGNEMTLSNKITLIVLPEDDISLTCSQREGVICSTDQICSGDWLGTGDTPRCCSTVCQEVNQEFGRIQDRKDTLSDDLKIEIKSPSKNDKFSIGDEIMVEIELENRLEERIDYDLDLYLYSITDNEIIEEVSISGELAKGTIDSVELSIEIPEDLDEGDDYAIFIKINEDHDEHYNEDYILIEIERKEYDIIIEQVNFNSEFISCGDYVEARLKIVNLGSEEEDFYVTFKNEELGINETTEQISIKAYGDGDSIYKKFMFEIPSVRNGEYVIISEVHFGVKSFLLESVLNVEGCEVNNLLEEEKIELENERVLEKGSFPISWVLGLSSLVFLVLLVFVFMRIRR